MGQRCFIALGANLGDPVVTVTAAILALRGLPRTQFIAASSLYRTAPVGLRHQPNFINAVVELAADSSAPELLESLFALEERFGRRRSVRNAPRTLDLDLLLYGDVVSADPQLTLPHPRLHERAFVLAPLAEIAPRLVIPGRGSIGDLLLRCADQRVEKLLPQAAQSSTKAFSRVDLTAGSSTIASSSSARTNKLADKGRVTNTDQSPRDKRSARRKYSSIIGPRT